MNHIPEQPLAKETCLRCHKVIRLVNDRLEPKWIHEDTRVDWCELKAVPASRPWPESVQR